MRTICTVPRRCGLFEGAGQRQIGCQGYDNKPIARYNVAPSTRVNTLHTQNVDLRIDPVRWGWAPFWAKGKKPDPINARVKTVTTGKFFKQLLLDNRALGMADGWYEWVRGKEHTLPPFYLKIPPLYNRERNRINLSIPKDKFPQNIMTYVITKFVIRATTNRVECYHSRMRLMIISKDLK